jgi:hypothetical protein
VRLAHLLAGATGPDGRPGTQQHAAEGNTPPRSEQGGNDDARSYAGESVAGGAEEAGEPEVVPDMPRSWVPKLAISRELYDMRCPKVRCWRSRGCAGELLSDCQFTGGSDFVCAGEPCACCSAVLYVVSPCTTQWWSLCCDWQWGTA